MSRDQIHQVAFYGKGGIGKSTTVANVSSALAVMGKRVLQVGCDPKHDSSRPFWSGKVRPKTVIELLRDHGGNNPSPQEYVWTSASGVKYLEVGGPEPGVGCAGRGILKMLEMAEESRLLDQGYDVVIYDILGDVVCGGFAAPLRSGYAREVYIVLSGEFMAMFAANNICRGVANYAERRHVRLGGFVLNCRDVPGEREIVTAFAEKIGSRVVSVIPRSRTVAEAERARRTVVEAFPDSEHAGLYRELAQSVLDASSLSVPKPMADEELEDFYYEMVDKTS